MHYQTEQILQIFSQDNLKSLNVPVPSLAEQSTIVIDIENQLDLVNPNKQIINVFTKKIENLIDNLWIK